MKLIIVESPTKAKTFAKLLPAEYKLLASVGHVRDLPVRKIGIDVEHDFKPEYTILKEKKATVDEITKLAKKASEIILATDADREGEAISYHLAFILGSIKEEWPASSFKKGAELKRIVFHEITKEAIDHALKNPSTLNFDLINAQQARRLLDRIVGYKLSPLLWNKMGKRWLSAGRVQTVALRFIVEREKEIAKFETEPFVKVKASFDKDKILFDGKLISKDGKSFQVTKKINLFDGTYSWTRTTIDKKSAPEIEKQLKKDSYLIDDLVKSVVTHSPPPPFTTSTLQQDAARLMGYSSKYTMSLAQKLYEHGVITYHRTDSITLSQQFVDKALPAIEKEYGKEYLPAQVRVYKSKVKNAQEAHEAIRPTKLTKTIPVDAQLSSKHQKLYDLIYNRTLGSLMAAAQADSFKLHILSSSKYLFETKFELITFPGYQVLYGKKPESSKVAGIQKGEKVLLKDLLLEENTTNPPPRYTEASLIKTLESKGIGRPSTYAPTISVILVRNYVEKEEGKFKATMLGTAVCDYLSGAFKTIFDPQFTAKLEDQLDEIAVGKEDMVHLLKDFYGPMDEILQKEFAEKKYIDIEEKSDEKCDLCGAPMIIRISKYGKFHACTKYPECKGTKSFVEKIAQKCPKCGGDMVVKLTKKKRKFFGCANYPTCTYAAWKVEQIESDAAQETTNKIQETKKSQES